jgi:predicted kinase
MVGMSSEAPSPVLVVAGPAGSGKSTLGRSLAALLGAAVLDQDVATNPLMAQIAEIVGAGDDLDHPALRGPVRDARYRCLVDVAADNARVGTPAVMIAPFTAEVTDAARWTELVGLLGTRTELVWVTVPPEVAWARRQQRGLPRDVAAAGPAAALPEPVVPHVAADGAAEPDGEAARVAAALGLTAR